MSDIILQIQNELLSLQDKKYKEFHSKLLPTVDIETIIGVRVPIIRKLGKKYIKDENIQLFLNNLPHKYYEENQLHMVLIEETKDYEKCIEEIEKFIPYINNWAVCDGHNPKVFKKHLDDLFDKIKIWIGSTNPYSIRFAINMLMNLYLDEAFEPCFLEIVASVDSEKVSYDKYYVDMEIAWYFATALAKQYEATLPYIENKVLNPWAHNKAIQKARESYRITSEQKQYLNTLKIK